MHAQGGNHVSVWHLKPIFARVQASGQQSHHAAFCKSFAQACARVVSREVVSLITLSMLYYVGICMLSPCHGAMIQQISVPAGVPAAGGAASGSSTASPTDSRSPDGDMAARQRSEVSHAADGFASVSCNDQAPGGT